MIRLFRKIRQQLLSETKYPVYLLYAGGEILLVVVGILVALQIDNWSEKRKNQTKEIHYLNSIRNEIVGDSIFLKRSWIDNFPGKIASLQRSKVYLDEKPIIQDTIEFIISVGIGGRNGLITIGEFNTTYKELISTGNLSLISDNNLRQQIVSYYSYKEYVNEIAYSRRSGIVSFLNSSRPWNRENPDYVSKSGIPRILEKYQSDEFYDLINKEMTYAYAINYHIENIVSLSNELDTQIEGYIKDR